MPGCFSQLSDAGSKNRTELKDQSLLLRTIPQQRRDGNRKLCAWVYRKRSNHL
jgi:hypothetical protein